MDEVSCVVIDGLSDVKLTVVKHFEDVCLVGVRDRMVFVIIPDVLIDGDPFVPYVCFFDTDEKANKRFQRKIGKLVTCDYKSRYFGKPRVREHMKNGLKGNELTETSYEFLKETVEVACQLYYNSL